MLRYLKTFYKGNLLFMAYGVAATLGFFVAMAFGSLKLYPVTL